MACAWVSDAVLPPSRFCHPKGGRQTRSGVQQRNSSQQGAHGAACILNLSCGCDHFGSPAARLLGEVGASSSFRLAL